MTDPITVPERAPEDVPQFVEMLTRTAISRSDEALDEVQDLGTAG